MVVVVVCTRWRRDEDLIILGFESQSDHCTALSRSHVIGRGMKLTVQFYSIVQAA
jgi:hypothetical protein